MKLQQATRCAIWAILELASRPKEKVGAKELALTYGMSQNHLAKVLQTLTRAKIVSSIRGPGGGFTFCGNAKRLTLFDIISLFESDWPVEDVEHGTCSDVAIELHKVLGEVDRIISATLRSVTVETIIKNARRKEGRPSTISLPMAS